MPAPSHATPPTIEHVDCRESVPESPPAGTYVVVDVMHFSTTVTELLAMGATGVHVPEQRGQEFAFREEHPQALIGGPKTDDYEPLGGYDFFNSPSYVQSLPVTGRPVSFTSTNGGRAVADLRERGGPEVTVYVGSTTNAAALGRHLRAVEEPVYLLSAGTNGESATEDHVGAVLIDRYVRGDPPTPDERETLREHLLVARGPDYATKNVIRNADVTEYAMALDSRTVVPRLVDDRLVDVAEPRQEHEPLESLA